MARHDSLDIAWVRRSFMVSSEDLTNIDIRNRHFTTASLKYVSTAPGGNIMINPPPQFTRLADIKPQSIRGNSLEHSSQGMPGETEIGRYYSEALDDHAHIVHFQMGKTAFNSMLGFLTSYYSFEAAYMARTGRAPGFFYDIGRAAGMVIAIKNIAFVGILFISKLARAALQRPSTKYAYLKPTMLLYWGAVQTIVNHIASDMGMIAVGAAETKILSEGDEALGHEYDGSHRAKLHEMMPQLFDKDGGINVYDIATRGQRRANKFRRIVQNHLDSASDGVTTEELLLKIYSENHLIIPKQEMGWFKAIQHYLSTSSLGLFRDSGSKTFEIESNKAIKEGSETIADYMEAELNDGSAWVTFRVDEGGSVSESFTNSAAESGLKSKLDEMAADVRSKVNSFAGGNISDDLVGQIVQNAIGAAGEVLGGTLDTMGLGGLAGLVGGAYADIPQHWESSMAQMPRANYTIKLLAPYENPVSKMLYEIIPLAMLLAMAIPHAVGPQAYTGPFMLAYFDRGRAQCRYGMIDSISITRGIASTAFNANRQGRGIEVNLSIIDLSSVMCMPLSEAYGPVGDGTTLSAALAGSFGGEEAATDTAKAIGGISTTIEGVRGIFTDDTNFSDYMAILSGLGLAENVYFSKKIRRSFNRALANWNTHYSTPALAMAYGESWLGNIAKGVFRGADKAF